MYGLSATVATSRPSMAASTEMAGVMIPSPKSREAPTITSAAIGPMRPDAPNGVGHQRQQSHDAALPFVVCPHQEGEVLDRHHQGHRPDDQRNHAEDVVGRGSCPVPGVQALLERVERARADVAEHDARRAQDQHRHTGASPVHGIRRGRWAARRTSHVGEECSHDEAVVQSLWFGAARGSAGAPPTTALGHT